MKTAIFSSIRFKLVIWHILILMAIIGVSDFILYKSFEKSMIESIDNTLYTAAEEVEHAILLSPPEEWQKKVKQVERDFIVNRLFINIYEIRNDLPSPRTIARTGILTRNISEQPIREFLRIGEISTPYFVSINERALDKHTLRLILFPLLKNRIPNHIIQVGTSLKKVFTTLKKLRVILFIFAPIILIFTSLGGYFILGRALIPVRKVVETARSITTADLSLRIDSRGRKDEIGQLIITFNDMIGRLEKSVEQIKQFSSEVSHELKTPLTIIRGEIEIILRKERKKEDYKKTLASVYDEAVNLQKMVNALLFLSQIISQEHQFSYHQTALDEVVLKSFEKTVPLARQKDIKLLINSIDPCPILGEETLLGQMIMNILDNAIKYTPARGQIEITLINRKNQPVLIIKDNGIGIPSWELPRVFERFFRADNSQPRASGSLGLGLSIVKKITDMHLARIKIRSKVNQGTTLKIFFPPFRET